jgi:hypothetical protein
MCKYDESKLEKMNPNSRQHEDQCDRVDGHTKDPNKMAGLSPEDTILIRRREAAMQRERHDRRILRQIQWRTH